MWDKEPQTPEAKVLSRHIEVVNSRARTRASFLAPILKLWPLWKNSPAWLKSLNASFLCFKPTQVNEQEQEEVIKFPCSSDTSPVNSFHGESNGHHTASKLVSFLQNQIHLFSGEKSWVLMASLWSSTWRFDKMGASWGALLMKKLDQF